MINLSDYEVKYIYFFNLRTLFMNNSYKIRLMEFKKNKKLDIPIQKSNNSLYNILLYIIILYNKLTNI